VKQPVGADVLRKVVEQVSAPEMHARIRDAIDLWLRPLPDDAEPAMVMWNRLAQDSDVVLHGGPDGTYYLLRENNRELRQRDVSTLRSELIRVMTPAGAIELVP
jgi:hypothetical protein